MAAPAGEPSVEMLGKLNKPWTARSALDLLPDHGGDRRNDLGDRPRAEGRRGAGVREDG
jgi:hypothetical protein